MMGSLHRRIMTCMSSVVLLVLTSYGSSSAQELHPGQNCFQFSGVNCASIQIDSATAGGGVVAVTGDKPDLTTNTVIDNVFGLSTTPEEIAPGGFNVSTFKELGEIFIGILFSKSGIKPSFTSNQSSSVNTHAVINQQLVINGPTSQVDVGFEIGIDGDIFRPRNPGPGGVNVSHQWSVESVFNGNPIETSIFSSSISYNESDSAPDTRGFSANSILLDLNEPDAAGNTSWHYQSQDEIFDSARIQTGIPFTLKGSVFSQVFADGFEGHELAQWSHDSSNSSELTLSLPQGYTFSVVSQVPEPCAILPLVMAIAGMLSQRRAR